MEISSVLHIPKSNYAYPCEENKMMFWIRTKKNDVDEVFIKYTDPFCWYENKFNTTTIKMEKKYTTLLYDYYNIKVICNTKRIKYIFLLVKDNIYLKYGAKEFNYINELNESETDLFNFFNFPFLNLEDIQKSPQWSKEIVWYQIFIDRFNNIDGFSDLKWNSIKNVTNDMVFGGNIKGIINKLNYLSDLGIGGIYFTPLFKAKSVHKYDTIDYYKIDPSFGSNDDFKQLVIEAHKLNIKVMVDIVFNHCGYFHPFFQDVIINKSKSKYYNYFLYLDETTDELFVNNVPNYHTFAFTSQMPKWNTQNSEVQDYLLDIARYWINNYDVDGYRLDVSNEVSHFFWKNFCNSVRKLKDNFLIIGENWDNSLPWLGVDQFDSVMNYELYYPLIKFFSTDNCQTKINSEEFVSLINQLIVSYPENNLSSMFNLVGCHDTARIKTKCNNNENITKLVYLFLFIFTGCPNIYYGDELGICGGNDPDNRRCMNFDLVGNDFYIYTKKLIHIRKSNLVSLSSVDIEWLYTKENILVFKKKDIYCIINNNTTNKTIDTTYLKDRYIDLFTNKELSFNIKTNLASYQYFLLKKINF